MVRTAYRRKQGVTPFPRSASLLHLPLRNLLCLGPNMLRRVAILAALLAVAACKPATNATTPTAAATPLLSVSDASKAAHTAADQFMLLALPQHLDRQPQLLFDLVHRLVIQIGDPGMDAQDGLGHA